MILIGKYNCLVSFAFRCYAISDNSVDPSIGPVGSPPGIGMHLRDLPDAEAS